MEILQKSSKDRIRNSLLVERIRKVSQKWETQSYDAVTGKDRVFLSDQVVYALPSFTRKYVLRENSPVLDRLVYSPWLVANLFVKELPQGKGHPPAWENVLYKSPSLGYVVSTHQDLRAQRPQSVLTYYQAFGGQDTVASRRFLLPRNWETWTGAILQDLKRPHPDISDLVTRVDLMVHAHAMIRPIPGYLWGGEREKLPDRKRVCISLIAI